MAERPAVPTTNGLHMQGARMQAATAAGIVSQAGGRHRGAVKRAVLRAATHRAGDGVGSKGCAADAGGGGPVGALRVPLFLSRLAQRQRDAVWDWSACSAAGSGSMQTPRPIWRPHRGMNWVHDRAERQKAPASGWRLRP